MAKAHPISDGRYSERAWLAVKKKRQKTGAHSIGKKMKLA